ncbi:efflux RND transporter periplasmic adaptor subunit [Pseudomonas sp. MWU12-2037]|uniref:efflux RND transporter periplasmic adaptor subunit n=1 Tax=Pseudomonas sp. MWU12-2037 TaxID=2928690 RepID=UPI00200C9A52|nr:efflux RND transporter periplasmic adaptor subunit [Pseudomonas sp. MWU12-2037]
MNNSITAVGVMAVAALLCACSPDQSPVQVPRPVRTVELRYDNAREANRYVGTVQSRHEVDQAFRVDGKVVQRKVEVGQLVHEGDVLATLDDSDYRLAVEAARQSWAAAVAQARQADSDHQRLGALKADGSVSVADDERARTSAETSRANAEAEARKLELARNRLNYSVLRASWSGVVTAVHFEVGQVVTPGAAVISIADPGLPEIVVDVPEDHLAAFKQSGFKASLASAPGQTFAVALRELSPQAAPQTRTYRARMKLLDTQPLPLGATATLEVERQMTGRPVAAVPATALTQSGGQPALWVVTPTGKDPVGTVELVPVGVSGYRNDEVLVSGPPAGALIVTAGVQKMAPGLKVALPGAVSPETKAVVTR